MVIFKLNLNISGTLAYNVFLGLFSWKKKEIRDEKRDSVSKEKAVNFTCFWVFVRYKINLGINSIMQLTHAYLTTSRTYTKERSMMMVIENRVWPDTEDWKLWKAI